MSIYTWLWLGIGVAALVLEGVALFNSRRGDTLSEHVWAWLGVRRGYRQQHSVRDPDTGQVMWYAPVTPKWTLRVARLMLVTFLVWLTLHFVTGGWV